MLSDKTKKRFMCKFVKKSDDECWEWQASCFKNRMGYGAFGSGIGKQVISAHRASYMIFVGEITNKLCVLHKCDNPKCVNPKHLFLGTYADNNADMVNKGRAARKLTKDSVLEIRKRELSTRELAKKFGVSQHMIFRVQSRIAWKHVT